MMLTKRFELGLPPSPLEAGGICSFLFFHLYPMESYTRVFFFFIMRGGFIFLLGLHAQSIWTICFLPFVCACMLCLKTR